MAGEPISAALSVAGSVADYFLNKQASNKEYKRQKEFAQSGIQWKVADAEKAGIHPLYALGANTVSYGSQSVGGSNFADAGQNIGRAIDATRSNQGKADALALTAAELQLEGIKLDNEFKRAQLASAAALVNQTSNPGIPDLSATAITNGMPGQGNWERVQGAQQTPTVKFGSRLQTNPNFTDAQSYEDRYGEMSDYVMGPMILAADVEYNRRQHFNKEIRPYLTVGPDGRYRLTRSDWFKPRNRWPQWKYSRR